MLADEHPADRYFWQSAKGLLCRHDGGQRWRSLIVVAPNPGGVKKLGFHHAKTAQDALNTAFERQSAETDVAVFKIRRAYSHAN